MLYEREHDKPVWKTALRPRQCETFRPSQSAWSDTASLCKMHKDDLRALQTARQLYREQDLAEGLLET